MAGYTPSIVEQQIYGVLQPFIVTVTGLASNLVIQGLPNRSAMPPASPGFVTMQTTRQRRLNYNIDTWDPTDPNVTSISIEKHIKLAIQLDVYGATSEDWANVLETVLRDDVGVQALAPTCAPLYLEDFVLAPLDDTEMQYEHRWTGELYVQYNPVITPLIQSANTVGPVDAVNVGVRYPM